MTHEIMAMMEKRRMFKNRNTEKYKGVNQKKKKILKKIRMWSTEDQLRK